MSIRPNFKLCEKLATQLLAKQNISSAKINVCKLKYDKKIIFDSIQNYCELTNLPLETFINEKTQLLSEGCTIYIPEEDIYLILYNDKPQCEEHLNWTLAHEIGHIYLRHTSDDEIDEVEAHFFAAQLLMPEYTIYMMTRLGKITVNDIYMVFNVSFPAAEKRLKTYNKKYSIRNGYNDKRVWEMMKSNIKDYFFMRDSSIAFKTFISTSTKAVDVDF